MISPNESRALGRLAQALEGPDAITMFELHTRNVPLVAYPAAWQEYVHNYIHNLQMSKGSRPDVVKYSEDQPRDENGRFGSGGSSDSKPADNYHGGHHAPTRADEFGSPAHNIEEMMPGFYEHPERYSSGNATWDKESKEVLMRIKDKPDAPVTIYRAVPKDVNSINPGDWVTLSRSYAEQHNDSNLNGEGHILSQQITANDLWFDGDSINEFGFDPQTNKALRPELKLEPTQGVPGPLEVKRALSRLAILPNPADITIEDPEKYVESPWETVPVFTFDPNLWGTADLTILELDDLVGTDNFLLRKKVKKHIESMGQALMPYRHYALVVVKNGNKVILDGHHRLMAQWLLGQPTAPVWLVQEK